MALYPPVVASSMPAFNIADGKVKIYFTLSNYNSSKIDDIKKVHVTVRRQSSNVNVLTKDTQIVEKDILQEETDIAFNRFFIQILNSDIKDGFKEGVLYKVQLRFSDIAMTGSEASFYTNNIEHFSEWSTVCIIKPIQVPVFYIDDFHVEGEQPKETDENNFNYNLADFVGIYKAESSGEVLKSWRLRLLNNSYSKDQILNIDNYTLADSGIQLVSVYNYTLDNNSLVLECSLPYELEEKTNYKLLFQITTKNDYQNSILYTFKFTPQSIDALPGTFSSIINEEDGYIKLVYNSETPYFGNLVIRRSDSKSNFLKWEDLKNFESHQETTFTYYDFTAQSGLAYRYLIQRRDARGRRGTPLYTQSYVIAQWEHALLLQSNGTGINVDTVKQLKLKFDFQISSYKTNIAENKTDTIGSKYPFIRRNGNMYYRSFPCTGLITAFSDNTDLFTNNEELYDNHVDMYEEFQGTINNFITQYDYTYERKFREKVEQFLYNTKPKLYKSMQEGNILIKLMDVSLTPKTELGRLIYSFSATAYEIDQATIKNYDYYGLINIGNYNPNIHYEKVKIGQINSYDPGTDKHDGRMFIAGQDIVGAGLTPSANSIAKKHNYNKPVNGEVTTDFKITWLRITIESQPYLIKQINGRFYPIDDVDSPQTPVEESDPLNRKRSTFSSFKDKRYVTTEEKVEYIGNAAFDYPSEPGDITHKLYQMESSYDGNSIYLGTLLEINGQQIIIAYPNNIYELKGQEILLSKNFKIIPYKDTAMTVDYTIILHIEEDLSKVPKFIRIDGVNGQLIGTFDISQQLISRIRYTYRHNYTDDDKIEKYVNSVESVLVDTEPGAVVLLKSKITNEQVTNLERFVVNETGQLLFDPCDSTISIDKLYIKGMNIPTEMLYSRGSIGDISEIDTIQNPIDKDMVQVGSDTYIYYKNNWYKATSQDKGQSYDIECPVDALLFYYANVRRDFY